MAETPYVPIDCGIHSTYEVAILNRKWVEVKWCDENGDIHASTLLPKDLITRDGGEFLQLQDETGQSEEIRLDRIESIAY
ncbi:MAG: transcriptional antiterminator, Rof [Gammaproteobacteria bacterium]|nr:transcriptional antiterminator, Rof [Gammaproteobacteria bacterium]